MTNNKILIVEDDKSLLDVLKYNLAKENYSVLTAIDGVQALEMARDEKPDLVILDIMLPKLDGFEVCRILRKETTVPILMLTAKVEEIDKVVGLEMGADDYITKPFSFRELLARIRAVLRRKEMLRQEVLPKEQPVSPPLRIGNLGIDFARHQVFLGESILDLRPREFELLAFLLRNRGRAFSRDYLLENVWGYDYAGDTRTVDVHIRWLRQKIEKDPAHPQHLLTVHGVGYKFEG
ncbi:MAG: response regulator transcription factor [Dehalococcoidia bacterium]|nr:response regulator transcription factor [Dehalococcoidia bacterium]